MYRQMNSRGRVSLSLRWPLIALSALLLIMTAPSTASPAPGSPGLAPAADRMACSNRIVVKGEVSPLLTAVAPPDAQDVTAYLPWGVSKKMRYDALRGHWYVRTPPAPMVYHWQQALFVRVKDRRGEVNWRMMPFPSGQSEPLFIATVPKAIKPGKKMRVAIDPLVPVKRVSVMVDGFKLNPERLHIDPATERFEGKISTPAVFPRGKIKLEVQIKRLDGRHLTRTVAVPARANLSGSRC